MKRAIGIATVMVLAVLAPALAQAAEIKVAGTVTYVTVSEGSRKLADGRNIMHFHNKGVVRGNDATNPFHLVQEDCFDTVILAADGNFVDGAGYCDNLDKDGDAYWFSWTATPTGSKWTIYHGTGKYSGMTGGGTSVTEVNFPDRFEVTYEGTITMK